MIFSREFFFPPHKIYSYIYTRLFENLKATILKSIITLSVMGQQNAQAKKVYCDLKLLYLKNLSVFYKNVLAVWQELNSKNPHNTNKFKQEIIWNNRFKKIDGKSFYYKAWGNKGIWKISEILDIHGQSLSFENFKCKFGIHCTFLNYAGVLVAIPKFWKRKIIGNVANGDNEPVPSLNSSSTKKACVMHAERSFSCPIVEISLRKQVLNVKTVYELPFKVTVENKLRSFQFKLMHNIIPINHSL